MPETLSGSAAANPPPLLQVSDLRVEYPGRGWRARPVVAIGGVSLHVGAGETVGLVGESGSGKSTIGRAILGLAPTSAGVVAVDGTDLAGPGGEEARGRLHVVFQDPFGSLNPARTIGATLREPLEARGDTPADEATRIVTAMLKQVGLPPDSLARYPQAFSGGQRQRIGIARALTVRPSLIVCDEATSALDLLTRTRIVELLREIQEETGVSYLFIAHDLPLVASLAHRVVVLYRGRVMEQGPARAVDTEPLHPYTRALIAAVPSLDPRRRRRRGTLARSTAAVQADPPEEGCPFAPRCPSAADPCWSVRPRDLPVEDRVVACHLYDPTSGHPGVTTPGPSPSTIPTPAPVPEGEHP